MGGLADEETAAMLIAHELRDEEVNGIADIEPGMEDVKFLAKVVAIGEVRTFERDDEDEDGRVINVEAADESGSLRLAFWDGRPSTSTRGTSRSATSSASAVARRTATTASKCSASRVGRGRHNRRGAGRWLVHRRADDGTVRCDAARARARYRFDADVRPRRR